MGGTDKPGNPRRHPSAAEAAAGQELRLGVGLHLLSIAPFGSVAAFSVIAVASWTAAVVIGLIPAGLLVPFIWATRRGFDAEPALFFWPFAEITCAALVLMEGVALVGREAARDRRLVAARQGVR